jgi:hypothetical protein
MMAVLGTVRRPAENTRAAGLRDVNLQVIDLANQRPV